MRTIFVFGSNTEGRHGAGAALHARQNNGAVYGQARGLQGDSWGIVTKDLGSGKRSVTLNDIKTQVDELITYANQHPDVVFEVTRIGCGLAGYMDHEIAPMFVSAPGNMRLPSGWRK